VKQVTALNWTEVQGWAGAGGARLRTTRSALCFICTSKYFSCVNGIFDCGVFCVYICLIISSHVSSLLCHFLYHANDAL